MKKIFLLTILVFISVNAQSIPFQFKLEKSASTNIEAESQKQGSNTIEDIAVSGDTIVMATARSVSISIDNGLTWNNFEDFEPFDTEQVARVAFKNGVIWASLWHSETIFDAAEPVGGGLIYSHDLGENWTFIEQPRDSMADSTIVYGVNTLKITPTTTSVRNFTLDIELTSDAVWITSRGGGVRKSTDMGQTWQRVVLPPDYLDYITPDSTYSFYVAGAAGNFSPEENLNHIPFSVLAVNDNTIFVGTAGGLNKSTDGGISWRKYNHTNQAYPISGNHVWNMKYDPYDSTLWACTWKAQGDTEFPAISMTKNMGDDWSIFLPSTKVEDIAFRYFKEGTRIVRRDILAATQEGLFRSENDGNAWLLAPTIFDSARQLELPNVEMHAIGIRHYDNNEAVMFIGTEGGGLVKLLESTGPWDGDWEILFLNGEDVSESNSSFAFPNPFSPIRGGINIKYSLKQPSDVTIRILDFGMNLVKTISQNAPRNSSDEIIERWDGRDESGSYVSNGVYFYRIDAGSNEPLFGKILVVK